MTQEQCTHRNNVQSSEKPHVYKVGIYGWRKRCLYFFVLLLMILILVNLALTIWILKVMNFTIDGMGNLRITEKGLKLEGDSEFLQPLYAKEIQSRPGSPLLLQSSKNVSINILNGKNQLVTQLIAGSSGVHARGKMLEVKSSTGKLLFSADDQEVVVGAERLRVTGAEGAVFSKSVETPHVRAEPFKELRLSDFLLSTYCLISWTTILSFSLPVLVPFCTQLPSSSCGPLQINTCCALRLKPALCLPSCSLHRRV
ncbi:delta-sarcoglycan-like isoform 4-T4 [Salvelinus alpinus]|uniref:delta-sarcoglycan-like isoform X2 n=1 Tax=Salvelinus alpinus TaxID=8036 RepID=UPI0039FD432F